MWEMATGQHPWAGMSDAAIIEAVTENCQMPPLPTRAPSALKVRAACLMLVVQCGHGSSAKACLRVNCQGVKTICTH